MYHPQHDRGQEQRTNRPEQGTFVRTLNKALPVMTVVFWVAAAIFVVFLAVASFVGSTGAWLSWLTGISLLVVVLSSGALAWVEFSNNSMEDSERGEWTNKMLFYGLVFSITFFVAFLYWMGLLL